MNKRKSMTKEEIKRVYTLLCYELANLRKDKHLTQGQVSKSLGISSGYLSKIENAKVTNVPLEFLMEICSYYKRNFQDVFEIAEEKMRVENKQKE
jgi:transcriptional regulator with XRE-family HTH domain